MSNVKLEADVIIVGCGMVGLALAAALPDNTLRIVLIDKHLPVDEKQRATPAGFDRAFDQRVSALTLASQQLLTRVGAWPFIKQNISPYTDMHVWDAEGTGSIHFSAAEIHEPILGTIVENSVTQAALWKVVQQKPNVQFVMASVVGLSEEVKNTRELNLDNEQTVSGKIIVAADGAHSSLRELAYFDLRQWSYEHTAIVVSVKTEKPNQQTAWQRFTVDGPLAFLPLHDEYYSSIVWSLKTQKADVVMALSDAEFMQQLSRAFEYKLGNVIAADARMSFPLIQRHSKEYVKARIALVGDAAHTIHPLAGQGVNLGFLDAAVLAEEIINAHKRNVDIGSESTLKKFESRRQGHNLLIMASMEGFKRLFEQEALPVRWLRNVGLSIVDKLSPVKSAIMKRAMGLEGDLPEMVRR